MDVVSPRLTGMGDEEGLSLFLAPCVGDCRVLVIQFLARSERSDSGSVNLSCFVSLAFLPSVPQRGKRNANAFGNQCSSWGNRCEFGILGVCSLPVPGATLVRGSFFRVLEVLSSS